MTALATIGHLVQLTKPRIVLLVLTTAFSGMWIGSGGAPPLALAFYTLLGVACAAGSSSALNNFIDRNRDALMERTRKRVLPSGKVRPTTALALGISLGLVSFTVLSLKVNLQTALLALWTICFYVLIYTLLLKPTTPGSTVLGGIAGAMPPVMGLAAVGELGWAAVVLFAILFLWQPPHFWALALFRREEYRRAGFKILPVVSGVEETRRQMLVYTLLLIPVSVLPWFLGMTGHWYLAVAVALNAAYLKWTIEFVRAEYSAKSARRLFFYSIAYLTILFIMLFADCASA